MDKHIFMKPDILVVSLTGEISKGAPALSLVLPCYQSKSEVGLQDLFNRPEQLSLFFFSRKH